MQVDAGLQQALRSCLSVHIAADAMQNNNARYVTMYEV